MAMTNRLPIGSPVSKWNFDVVSLGDIYSVIGYYLHRKKEVDLYIKESNEEYDRLVEEYKSQPGARAYFARLEEFRRQKEMKKQAVDGQA